MFREYRPLWAEINLDNLKFNIENTKKLIGENTEYIAVIKADAYGHGAVQVARTCSESGVKWLGVSILDEALELRNEGVDNPILILGYTPYNKVDILVNNNISQTCFSYELAKSMSDVAVTLNKVAKIHIAVDTGMGRIGVQPTEYSADMVKSISELPNLKIEAIFTHFASADERDKTYTYEQFNKFTKFLGFLKQRGVNIDFRHAGNSAATIDLPDLHLEGVRVGVMQYGLYPSDEVMKDKIELRPVMSVKANIVHVKEVEAGTSISYGRRFTTKRKSIIATIPIGYADGYSRLLYEKAKVIINGQLVPVVGTICMDQCMVDVTDVGEVKVGDDAIIMGSSGGVSITAEDIASWLGTINYEVICMFSKRIPRVYVKNGKPIKVKNYLVK